MTLHSIPDAWFPHGHRRFNALANKAYAATSDARWPTEIALIEEVAPPQRAIGVQGLHEDPARSLLVAMLRGSPIPPLHVTLEHTGSGAPRYVVRDGFHRYYLSKHLGFTHLPIQQRPYIELASL